MNSTMVRALRTASLTFALFGMVHFIAAEPPGPFAGTYRLSDVVKDGAQVKLTVTLTLQNAGAVDVKGGIVTLMDSEPRAALIGSLGTVKMLSHSGQAVVSESFTISAAEYARWQSGGHPVFEFLVPAAGGAVEMHVQTRAAADTFAASN